MYTQTLRDHHGAGFQCHMRTPRYVLCSPQLVLPRSRQVYVFMCSLRRTESYLEADAHEKGVKALEVSFGYGRSRPGAEMIDLLDNDERFIAQLGIGWMVRLRKKTRQGKGGRGLVMMG